jgi:hypothetical protein
LGLVAFYFLRLAFSVEQAGLLALVIGFVAMASMLDAKQAEPEPDRFWVRINPNWDPLLTDYGIVTDEVGWEKIREYESDKWSLLRNGIGFTVLRPDFFYSNDHHYFFSEVHIVEKIEGLSPTPIPAFPDFVPRFYLKHRRQYRADGGDWEFGLITAESIKRGDPNDKDSSLVPVALLPYEFFSGKYGWELSRKKLAALDKKLTEAGWKRAEREDFEDFEGYPLEIEHRYVTLSYDSV